MKINTFNSWHSETKSSNIWNVSDDYTKVSNNTNSCFNHNTTTYNHSFVNNFKHKTSKSKKVTKFDLNKTKILEVKFNASSMKFIKSWMESHRKVYNKTLRIYKNAYKHNIDVTDLTFFNQVRDSLKLKIQSNKDLNKLIFGNKYPCRSFDNAVNDVHKHFSSCISNKHKNFNIKRMLMKDSKQRLIISMNSWSKNKPIFTPSVLKDDCMKVLTKTKFNLDTYKNMSMLQYDKSTHRFFLYLTIKGDVKVNTNKHSIALDPGVRTFQTGYASDMKMQEYGPHINNSIKQDIEKIHSLLSMEQPPKRRLRYLRNKVKNKVSELHWKVINDLCNNYKYIAIGKLSTQKCVSTKNNLSKINKDITLALRHFDFRMKLKSYGLTHGCIVEEVNEAYTTKICTSCGKYNDVKGSKTYSCTKCKSIIDRDLNGARNIFMKTLK